MLTIGLVLADNGPTRAADAPRERRVDVLATGLEAPWALTFDPAGALFVTERP